MNNHYPEIFTFDEVSLGIQFKNGTYILDVFTNHISIMDLRFRKNLGVDCSWLEEYENEMEN